MLAPVLLFLAATSIAQAPVVIERIDIHTKRSRPELLISEMRLPKGRPASIEEIEQAVYRLRRLPFVVDATYTLEPGSSGTARVLRINVVDETPVHIVFDVQGLAQQRGYVTTLTQIGFRFFPAPKGVAEIGSGGASHFAGGGTGGPHIGDVGVQYTAYGLFGTSAYAGIGVSGHYQSEDRLISPIAVFGIPLTQTQTIRGSYSRSGLKSDSDGIATLQWLNERTDDPYFARQGFSVAAGPQWEQTRLIEDFNGGKLHIDDRLSIPGFLVRGEKYWPVWEHGAYWARGNITFSHETPTNNGVKRPASDLQFGDVLGGIGWNFDQWRTAGEWFDRLRPEVGAGYHRERQEQGSFVQDRSGVEFFVSTAFRTRLGIFRLSLSRVNSKR
jgi:hypothetical protein